MAPPAPEAILPKRRGNDAENDPEDSDTATATRPAKKHQALSDAERAEREQAKEAREREREAAKVRWICG